MKKIFAIVLALALTACGQSTNTAGIPQLDQPVGQPQQTVQHGGGFDAGSAAIGAVGGAVLGHMLTKKSQPVPETRTVYVDRPVASAPRYVYKPTPAPARSSFSAPSVSRSAGSTSRWSSSSSSRRR